MKPDIKQIAQELFANEFHSKDVNTVDIITDALITFINPSFDKWTEEILEQLRELEHPKPKTKEEYNERYGIGEGDI